MITFLPYSNFIRSVEKLDNKRLGKQRVEAMQIVKTLTEGSKWKNHPAVKMWEGHIEALKYYHNCCINEWIKRGFNNTMQLYNVTKYDYPWWVGDEDFHRAMRARLIEKDEQYYLPKFPGDKGFNGGKYLWPVMENKTFRII